MHLSPKMNVNIMYHKHELIKKKEIKNKILKGPWRIGVGIVSSQDCDGM